MPITPLADPTYRRLFSAQVIALAGTGLATVALALLAYDLAGGDAGIVLGTALALKMVAYVFVAPVVGAFAHQLSRRSLLVGLDLGRAAMVGCLPFVTEVWQVYLLIFLLNACSAGFTPTFQATVPDVLPEEARYTRALSLSRLAYDLENLLSPMAAAGALLLVSYDALFAANAVAFVASAALIVTLRLPAPKPTEEDDVGPWDKLSFGTRVFLATPRLRGLLALYMAVSAAGAMVIVNTVLYVRDRLGGGESDTALAFAASGAGSMAVALVLPRLLDRFPDRPFLLAGGGLLAAGLFLGAAQPGFAALLAIWLLLGAGSSLVQTPAGRLVRRSCHAGDRPALFSAQFALSHACWLIAYPLAGWLGREAGMTGAFLSLGGVAIISTGLSLYLWPREQRRIEHRHAPMEHAHLHVHDEHHRHEHEGWEGPEPHSHPHRHGPLTHSHTYVVDRHHRRWPKRTEGPETVSGADR